MTRACSFVYVFTSSYHILRISSSSSRPLSWMQKNMKRHEKPLKQRAWTHHVSMARSLLVLFWKGNVEASNLRMTWKGEETTRFMTMSAALTRLSLDTFMITYTFYTFLSTRSTFNFFSSSFVWYNKRKEGRKNGEAGERGVDWESLRRSGGWLRWRGKQPFNPSHPPNVFLHNFTKVYHRAISTFTFCFACLLRRAVNNSCIHGRSSSLLYFYIFHGRASDVNLPTAGDIDREPDEELFGDEIGLIDCWLFCGNGCAPGPGCDDTLFGGGCWEGGWLLAAKFAAFSSALFWAAAAASCCKEREGKIIVIRMTQTCSRARDENFSHIIHHTWLRAASFIRSFIAFYKFNDVIELCT